MRRNEEETISDSFLAQANGHPHTQPLGSFHSDTGYKNETVRALPRRPESYHPQLHDGLMFGDDEGPSGTHERLPTFSSQREPNTGSGTEGRFARLAARYFNPPSDEPTNGYEGDPHDMSSDAMSDIPGMPDTPDIHTVFTSDQLSITSASPSPPPAQARYQPPPQARYPPAPATSSIVERTQTALQMRFASMDTPDLAQDGGRQQALLARAHSQPVMEGSTYLRGHQQQQPNGAELPTMSSYQNMTYSIENQSQESLDHPNLGSQGSRSPGNSELAMPRSEHNYYDGGFRESATPFEASRDHSFEHRAEHLDSFAQHEYFEPITNADDAFGDDYSSSSNPDMASIMRDHEQVFNDLFQSDDDDDEFRRQGHTISNEFDPQRPPASLFASSASIVAEISRRTGERRRNFSSWDAHEVTPEVMRQQELQYGPGVHNPIEMLNKSNSLGIPENESDISGLLPESERSSIGEPGPARAHPMTPRSAPAHVHATSPPPPTTPTTIISRDTRHGPASRILHNVPPFDPSSSRASSSSQQQMHAPNPAQPAANPTYFRRPAGPRALESAPVRRPPMLDIASSRQPTPDQRNARAAADFAASTQRPAADFGMPLPQAGDRSDERFSETSSHGLGSLFQDSLPTLDVSRMSRTPNPARISRLVNLPRSATQSPHNKSRVNADFSGSSLMTTSHSNYVPFQDPTVDVSQLARYGTVGMKHEMWSLRSQHKGVSADRMDSPVQRKLPMVADREIHSTHSAYESDDMVPTVRYDSPSPSFGSFASSLPRANTSMQQQQQQQSEKQEPPPRQFLPPSMRPRVPRASTQSTRVDNRGDATSSGPTLTDIYELLKKTASSIIDKPQSRQRMLSHSEFVPLQSQPDQPQPVQLQPDQSYPDIRPSAPTPRRSRQFLSTEHDEPSMYERGRSVSVHSRFQAFVQQQQREATESMVNHDATRMDAGTATEAGNATDADFVSDRMGGLKLADTNKNPQVTSSEINEVIESLGQAVRQHGNMDNIPMPLAEKLLELATVLATARDPGPREPAPRAVNSAVQTTDDNMGLGAELRRLQQDILAKFDECRTEVDMLRAEVRQGSSVSSPAHAQNAAANTSSIVPHDSVSAVAARNFRDAAAGLPHDMESDRLLTPSPRPASVVRPMYTVPTTVKNRQRQMVQWLNRQDEDEDEEEEFVPVRRRGTNHGSPSPYGKGGKRNFRTTVEDASDDDDGALSDASTTVPGSPAPQRMSMRSPLDPAMISPANVPSRRQQQQFGSAPSRRTWRGKMSAWEGNEDLLETRQALESIRRRRRASKDVEEDSFEKIVYDTRMAQELAHTLAELQRVHMSHFHHNAKSRGCPVCASLAAQNHDPYLFGKHAVAYKSMSTRELQKLLNAYVAAMEDEFTRPKHRSNNSDDDALGYTRLPKMPARHAFTPTRKNAKAVPAKEPVDDSGTRMVIELLHEELDALSRRYHRMVTEYHKLDPSHSDDQRQRRLMARELKDLVDLLDVKGEQISVLAGLHPSLAQSKHEPSPSQKKKKDGCIERAYQSAKALQQAL
ncbi:hypothetical protein GGF43_000940, partial [Coemansia sp. RSA 2618]